MYPITLYMMPIASFITKTNFITIKTNFYSILTEFITFLAVKEFFMVLFNQPCRKVNRFFINLYSYFDPFKMLSLVHGYTLSLQVLAIFDNVPILHYYKLSLSIPNYWSLF